jgi:hypothetical protein
LQYLPDITNIFLFARPGGELVSLSNNGMSIPGLYFASDLPKQVDAKMESSELRRMNGSEVRRINGRDASLLLKVYSNGTMYHDADARYNTVILNMQDKAIEASTNFVPTSSPGVPQSCIERCASRCRSAESCTLHLSRFHDRLYIRERYRVNFGQYCLHRTKFRLHQRHRRHELLRGILYWALPASSATRPFANLQYHGAGKLVCDRQRDTKSVTQRDRLSKA